MCHFGQFPNCTRTVRPWSQTQLSADRQALPSATSMTTHFTALSCGRWKTPLRRTMIPSHWRSDATYAGFRVAEMQWGDGPMLVIFEVVYLRC